MRQISSRCYLCCHFLSTYFYRRRHAGPAFLPRAAFAELPEQENHMCFHNVATSKTCVFTCFLAAHTFGNSCLVTCLCPSADSGIRFFSSLRTTCNVRKTYVSTRLRPSADSRTHVFLQVPGLPGPSATHAFAPVCDRLQIIEGAPKGHFASGPDTISDAKCERRLFRVPKASNLFAVVASFYKEPP